MSNLHVDTQRQNQAKSKFLKKLKKKKSMYVNKQMVAKHLGADSHTLQAFAHLSQDRFLEMTYLLHCELQCLLLARCLILETIYWLAMTECVKSGEYSA